MHKYLTDREITEQLKNLTILIDKREQVNQHLTEYFDKKKIPYIERSMSVGDYSAMLDDMTLEYEITCERKRDIDELASCMATDRDRFEREFQRAKCDGTKVFLIIENASWSDISLHNYRSKLNPQSLIASLLSWQVRFNITIIFCKPSETGQIIYGILYYSAREALKKGVI